MKNSQQFVLVLLCLLSLNAQASDHIDGPVTKAHRVADLTDFYAFPTPHKPGSLSLILNTYPLVSKTGHFTDKATYAFAIRKTAIAANKENSKFANASADEIVINCNITTPNDIKKHSITCKSTNGLVANNTYDSINATNSGDDFRLYAGMRSDPFFFNKDFPEAAIQKGLILKPNNSNVMDDMNVLSIVIEIETKKLYPDGVNGLLALATAVYTQDGSPEKIRILDRIGRPEITNVSMFNHSEDKELRDLYNVNRPFEVDSDSLKTYEDRLLKNIAYYDTLDKKTDWSQNSRVALAKLLADDFLVLDIAKPCIEDSFLEIEKSMLKGVAHTTCGGRKPTDDIMDTLFTTYISGLDGARIRDGVDAPYKTVGDRLPYLAEPELGFWAQFKARKGREAVGIKD